MKKAVTYKARLAKTRANDAAHEQMMHDAARKAGADLEKIRSMIGKTRDEAFVRMFAKVCAGGAK